MTTAEAVVSLDDPQSWPPDLSHRAHELAEQVRDQIDADPDEFPSSDLPLIDEEAEFRDLLDGHLLRAHHATRLLSHEVSMINERGMRALDRDLATDRLDAAHERGHITDNERFDLIDKLSLNSNRVGQVCLFLSWTAFDLQPGGLALLMETWGGEGIYWRHVFSDNPVRTSLRALGTPSIITTQIDLTAASETLIFPGLACSFVGAALGLRDNDSTIHYFGSIPATGVERIIQPGDPHYPQHPRLPQS